MFEVAEIGQSIAKHDYARELPELRESLLTAQYQLLHQARFPVILVVAGVDGAGKGEVVNLLNAWMDPRHIVTSAFGDASDEESERPSMWRFWRALPPKGQIGILFGSWYSAPMSAYVEKRIDQDALVRAVDEVRHFERMLTAEGALIVKFWFHLSNDAQKQRLQALEADKLTRWRVTADDWHRHKLYNRSRKTAELVLRETSTGEAPWHIIPGNDENYRSLTAGKLLLDAMVVRLAATPKRRKSKPASSVSASASNILSTLDYSATLAPDEYKTKLEKLQGKLALLTRSNAFQKRSLILAFEGSDAAGKGSTIRRITGALDARHYHVVPISAPTEEERAQPYLWRFWRQVPRPGRVVIFDRSWYGRVLVERVEQLIPESDWARAYHEINDFEEQLIRNGAILVKFWLAITKDEQLTRFKAREQTPFKNFKITPDDWRNREKWDDYQPAVNEMVERTSTSDAPWHVIPANDKLHARIKVLKKIVEAIERQL